MARQHAGTAVISEGHKAVVNIRTAGAASKCSAGDIIRIQPKMSNTTIQYTPNIHTVTGAIIYNHCIYSSVINNQLSQIEYQLNNVKYAFRHTVSTYGLFLHHLRSYDYAGS